MVNFVILLECFGICLIFIALFLLLNGDGAREQKMLIFIMCGSLVQNVGYILELTASTVDAEMTAVIIENVGSAFVPLCYCLFIYIYCYMNPPVRLLKVLFAVSFFILPTVIFNWHGIFYRDIQWKAAANIFIRLPAHKLGENIRVVEEFREEMLNKDIPQSFSINGKHYESHSKHIIDENGKIQGSVILILDMTDIKSYIEEIKRVRHEAEKASIAKSEFLANMSHEIRTPMNAIIGLNDIIMEECEDTEIYGYAKDVQSAAKNLLAIINDILDQSKVEAGKMELVSVNYYLKFMANEVIALMDMAASQRGLILINILNKAIKFTEKGYVRTYITGKPGKNSDEELLIFHCCWRNMRLFWQILNSFWNCASRRMTEKKSSHA